MLNIKAWSWALAGWAAVTYTLCVLWGVVAPSELHGRLLEVSFPGFRWLTPAGFIIGLAESVLYGLYAGALFVFLHNALWRAAGRHAVEHRAAETATARSAGH